MGSGTPFLGSGTPVAQGASSRLSSCGRKRGFAQTIETLTTRAEPSSCDESKANANAKGRSREEVKEIVKAEMMRHLPGDFRRFEDVRMGRQNMWGHMSITVRLIGQHAVRKRDGSLMVQPSAISEAINDTLDSLLLTNCKGPLTAQLQAFNWGIFGEHFDMMKNKRRDDLGDPERLERSVKEVLDEAVTLFCYFLMLEAKPSGTWRFKSNTLLKMFQFYQAKYRYFAYLDDDEDRRIILMPTFEEELADRSHGKRVAAEYAAFLNFRIKHEEEKNNQKNGRESLMIREEMEEYRDPRPAPFTVADYAYRFHDCDLSDDFVTLLALNDSLPVRRPGCAPVTMVELTDLQAQLFLEHRKKWTPLEKERVLYLRKRQKNAADVKARKERKTKHAKVTNPDSAHLSDQSADQRLHIFDTCADVPPRDPSIRVSTPAPLGPALTQATVAAIELEEEEEEEEGEDEGAHDKKLCEMLEKLAY
jgi:hypothetical protein